VWRFRAVSLSRIYRHGQFLCVTLRTPSLFSSSTIQIICKPNHGSFAPELAHPSGRSLPTERTSVQSPTNTVGIQPSTQATQLHSTINSTNTVLSLHQELGRRGVRFTGSGGIRDLQRITTRRARPRNPFGCRISVVSSPVTSTLPQPQIMVNRHRQPPAGP